MKIPLVISLLFATWAGARAAPDDLDHVLAQFVKKGADDWMSFFEFVKSAERKDPERVGKVVAFALLLEVLQKRLAVTDLKPLNVLNFKVTQKNGTKTDIATLFTASTPSVNHPVTCEAVIGATILPPTVFSLIIPSLPQFELLGDRLRCNDRIVVKTGPPLDALHKPSNVTLPHKKEVAHSLPMGASSSHPLARKTDLKHLGTLQKVLFPHKAPLKHVIIHHKLPVKNVFKHHKVPLKHVIKHRNLPDRSVIIPHNLSFLHKVTNQLRTPHTVSSLQEARTLQSSDKPFSASYKKMIPIHEQMKPLKPYKPATPHNALPSHIVPHKPIPIPHTASSIHKVPLKRLIKLHDGSSPHKVINHLSTPHTVNAPRKVSAPFSAPHKMIPIQEPVRPFKPSNPATILHDVNLKHVSLGPILPHKLIAKPVKKALRSAAFSGSDVISESNDLSESDDSSEADDLSESADISEVDDVSESDDLSEVDDVSESDDLSSASDDLSEVDDLSESYDSY